jgi:hypothetical protein
MVGLPGVQILPPFYEDERIPHRSVMQPTRRLIGASYPDYSNNFLFIVFSPT